jgi:hypothetical protein
MNLDKLDEHLCVNQMFGGVHVVSAITAARHVHFKPASPDACSCHPTNKYQ